MAKSNSITSMADRNERMQQKKATIEKKIRDDYDRLQNQIRKRAQRESAAHEHLQYENEARMQKANLLNSKGAIALDKVRRQQRQVEQ